MRVRILQRPIGPIDGVALDHYRVGGVHEVGSEVGSLFLAEGWVELVGDDNAAVFVRPPPPAEARKRPVVLIVDDDAEVRGLAEAVLSSQGYHVQTAADGSEAIQRLRERCPDVIVLDLNMPVMDGWRFRTEQRLFPEAKRATVPVLLMSGEDDAADAAVTLHAIGLVKKPVDPDDLLDAVSAAVARAS